MAENNGLPTTLLSAIRYFSDLDVATDFVAKLRWSDGPICPRCGGTEHSYLTTRRVWKCKSCQRQFSVKLGTIFEDSPLGLDKWLPAVWLIANSKNGISSHELGRALGVTQKSTWFMLHRIRLAMQAGSFEKFGGEVEVDATYIGGKARNMSPADRKRRGIRSGTSGKVVVAGAMKRDGTVRVTVLPDTTSKNVTKYVRDNVDAGATVYTDNAKYLDSLSDLGYAHQTVDHAKQYVDGQVHTNRMENFWSLLKRGLHGTYISVQPYHLFRYLDERVLTFNLREQTDLERFQHVLRAVAGRRLTWAQLTAKTTNA
jgi:transposase-like protein